MLRSAQEHLRNLVLDGTLAPDMTRSLLVLIALALVVCAPASAATLPASGTLDLADAPATAAPRWEGVEQGALAGGAVAGLGDFNGDGRDDVAVGEPKLDGAGRADAGGVRVLLDAKAGGKLDDAAKVLTFRGAAAGDNAGFDVAAAGDVNGDGLADLLVGAPLAAPGGAAYVVLGRRSGGGEVDLAGDFGGARIGGSEADAWLGHSVASLPDVTGDGRPEVLVGAPRHDAAGRTEAGGAYVVFGGAGGTGTVDVGTLAENGGGVRIEGPAANALGGSGLGSVGDLDGDGRGEILISAPRATSSSPRGVAYVVHAPATSGVIDLAALGTGGWPITAAGAPRRDGADGVGDRIGQSVSGVGDVNGDGLGDIVVGSHLGDAPDRDRSGIAYVVFGRTGNAPVDVEQLGEGGFRILGTSTGDQTGFSSAPAGDFNGDGLADLAIGAPFADPLSRTNAGAAYVVFGARGATRDVDLAEIGARGLRIAGTDGSVAGFSLDAAGDVDGDGGADLAIGAVAIDGEYLSNLKSTSPGSMAIALGGKPAGSEVTEDPGYGESVKAGCRPVLNVQAVLDDDDYNDKRADPQRIRLDGMQAYVATPRNLGTVIGVTGFDSDEGGESEPLIEPTQITRGRVDGMKKALFSGITGEDRFPGYGLMFKTLADDNPAAGARIMVIDGYTFGGVSELEGLTDGAAPTYIVAIGNPPDRDRDDIRQMRRVTRETKGRFFFARSARQLERALLAIQSRLRCDVDAANFREELDPGEEAEVAEAEIERGAHTADVTLTWREEAEDYEIEEIDVLSEDGEEVFRTIDDEEIDEAYGARASAPVSGGRGKTFRSLHLRDVRPGTRLRVTVRSDGARSEGRVYVRVTQSRSRR